jgi:hypothetical protein
MGKLELKVLQTRVVAFHLDENAARPVLDKTGKPQLPRQVVDKGPKAHALDDASNLDCAAGHGNSH